MGPIKRIHDVVSLRNRQFPEDAGPMRHSIRPDQYEQIENFYTPTVYEKGAEVIRMYKTILGPDCYRKATDLYFKRHDGQAVTCDDFRKCMADAADTKDKERVIAHQFGEWYKQAGTPHVALTMEHEADTGTLTIKCRQYIPGIPDQNRNPLPIPIRLGLLDRKSKRSILLSDDKGDDTVTLLLDANEKTWCYKQISDPPIISAMRGFSAPVILELEQSTYDLAFLLAHDPDYFNRWEAGQRLATSLILERVAGRHKGQEGPSLDLLVNGFRDVLTNPELEGLYQTYVTTLPSEVELGQQMATIDVEGIHAVRRHALLILAGNLNEPLKEIYQQHAKAALESWPKGRAARRLRNHCLNLLAVLGEPEIWDMAWLQFQKAKDMGSSLGALEALASAPNRWRSQAIEQFYRRWRHDDLVLDKWFRVQAASSAEDTLDRIIKLAGHLDFTLANPNRTRALLAAFGLNQFHFHAADGRGYDLLNQHLLRLDQTNPVLAARLANPFLQWRRFDEHRQGLMKDCLTMLNHNPSPQLKEVIGHALT